MVENKGDNFEEFLNELKDLSVNIKLEKLKAQREDKLKQHIEPLINDSSIKKIGVYSYNNIGIVPKNYISTVYNSPFGKEIHVATFIPANDKIVESKEYLKWSDFSEDLNLDHVIAYIGTSKVKNMVEMMRTFPKEKITYVSCDCNSNKGYNYVRQQGLLFKTNNRENFIESECNGKETLGNIIDLLRGKERVKIDKDYFSETIYQSFGEKYLVSR